MKNNISYIPALLAFALLSSACAKKNNSQQIVAPTAMTSKQQLENATFKSDAEKKALSQFITGTEFCEKYKSVTSTESGFYVTVPVDYQDVTKGTTKIWAYFSSGPFDSTKPTMIFFDGGSGGNTHGSSKILNHFNELHYDQRGIGCSHPETLELYRDPNFYSNLNNAKDADEIRKHLQIEKLSLYGASYGTVVATVYASVFEKSTQAVILDGTVYSDETDSKIIGFYLKKMFDSLSVGTQEGLKKYINSDDKLVSLFMLARILMYNNDPFGTMTKYLTKAFPSATEISQPLADKLLSKDLFQQVFFGDTIDSVEAFNNQMLNCKNMHQITKMNVSLFGPFGSSFYLFNNYEVPVDRTNTCNDISAKEDAITYSADQYPIHVPVTYLQGNVDGATFASGAIQHYKKVPTGQKQLLIAVKGGHCPGFSALSKKNPNTIELFESALLGNLVTKDQVAKLNTAESEVHWVFTTK